jgi:dipeptidyl aminopeptidase/acylaminoacyl peptidase
MGCGSAEERQGRVMRFLTGMIAVSILAVGTTAAGATEQEKTRPTPAAFGTPSRASSVRLSFDGKSAAWLDLGSVPQRIIVFDLVNLKDRSVFAAPAGMKLRDLHWSDDDTILFTASEAIRQARDSSIEYEYFRIFAAQIGSSKVHMLLDDQPDLTGVTGTILLAAHTTKPATAIVWSLRLNRTAGRAQTGTRIPVGAQDSSWISCVYEIDTRSGKSREIDEGSSITNQWVVDLDGNLVARGDWDEKSHELTILAKHGMGWTRIYHRNDGNQLELAGLTVDRKAIVAIGLDQDGRSKLLAVPLDGTAPQVLFEDPVYGVAREFDPDRPWFDRIDNRLLGVSLDGPDSEYRWIDAQYQQRAQALSKNFPGRQVFLGEQSADRSRLVVRVGAADKPDAYYVIDFTTHKADILAESYPALADTPLGKVSAITYKARDGSDIPAYLTTPAGIAAGTPRAMVVLVHGGPAARDYPQFDWLAQFIASRGYLVLQPQFRGSTGFGEEFRKAGIRQWGFLMQDDVTDGVKAMIDQKLADPRRICIAGGSYGGYAALAGAAFTPDLYACAISFNGVFDLPNLQAYFVKHSGGYGYLYWREEVGATQDPRLVEKSPGRHAASVKVPVLLLQSTEDTVVPPEQADSMAAALRLTNKPVKLVKMAGDDHWLSNTATRVQLLQEMDAFLQANLPP